MSHEKILKFREEFNFLIDKYPELSVVALVEADECAAVMGNTCPVCATQLLMAWVAEERIQHGNHKEKKNVPTDTTTH